MNKDELIKRVKERVRFGKKLLKISPNVEEWKKELKYDQQILSIIQQHEPLASDKSIPSKIVSEVSVPISDKIDERFVEEKVKDFLRKTYDKPIYPVSVRELKNFICQLISGVQPQKLGIDK